MSFISNLLTWFHDPTTATPLSEPLIDNSPCRFFLDNSTSATMTLPDGRKLGYAQYGSPTGKAILYNHGFPGSRLEGAAHHKDALELGLRFISIDRPGFGWSSPRAGGKVIDWAKDVQCLAEHLELEEYAVMGTSGGGPPTLACAYGLPSTKLKAVAIVCGMGPPDIGMRGAGWLHRLGWPHGIRYAPAWMGRILWRSQAIGRIELHEEKQLELMLRDSANAIESERDIFTDLDFMRLCLRACREAFAQGYAHMWADGVRSCMDFGFRVEDVRKDLKVHLWYGTIDTFVPIVHGRTIAERLGEGAVRHFKEEGHAGISVHWRREILEALRDSM
ncbi:alpha/beta hydrolase [Phaeosphaeriaceae sp. PMI808]|nr:alpha/beta hydrolase [Phaeosphaeriaceae sp. PMI808]